VPVRVLLTASIFQFVTYACFFNLTPLYPEVARDLNVDAGTLGTLVGIGGIVSLLVQVPGGSGGDRWGRRKFFGGAMLLLVLAQLARWLSVAPVVLLVAQILGGAAQGIATVNAWALVADATEGSRKGQGQAFGVLNANLALGLVTGYLAAGALGSFIGWRTMSLILALAPLLALLALFWVPAHLRSTAVRAGIGTVLRSVAYPPRLALTIMAGLTLAAGQGSLYLLPFGAQQRDLGPFAAALLLVPYVFGSVIAGPLGGRISDQLGTRPVIIIQLLVGALAAVALVWGAAANLVLIVCFVLIGASVNGALPLLAVRVIALGDASGIGAGSIMAGLRMGQSTGTFLGPAVAGLMLAHAGLSAAWVAQSACLVLSLMLLLLPLRVAATSTQASPLSSRS
jgi:DHA1 family bicyclomycin/chloramphenicol resistance-like MFS transporter